MIGNTEFKNKVYAIVSQIPSGKVMTYGQVAFRAGSPGAARAVGMCMKHNSNTEIVPCHRVVATDGKLTGYSAEGGIVTKKQKLLEEGVHFIGDKIDLSISQYNISNL